MKRIGIACQIAALCLAGAAAAQPTLDDLWPSDDGLRFSYTFSAADLWTPRQVSGAAYLQFDGLVATPGGEAQVLEGSHPIYPYKGDGDVPPCGGLLGAVWRARPDLRSEVAGICGAGGKWNGAEGYWWPSFLHTGYFLKSPQAIRMWQPSWDHPTWTYLEDDLAPGATFTFQLLPDIEDDIFLHGTIEDMAATVVTDAGTFTDAVKVAYLVDFGVRTATNEEGEAIGQVHSETRGHVQYVPGVGPVDMREEFLLFAWMDCGDQECPPEYARWIGEVVETFTLSLSALPVAETTHAWGEVKAMYR